MIEVGANSYLDIQSAVKYLSGHHDSTAWRAASDIDKAQALITATRRIDAQPLRGRRRSGSQLLAFPRAIYWQGRWHSEPDPPRAVCEACCEEALALLSGDSSEHAARAGAGIQSISIGDASITYSPAAVAAASSGGLMSPQAMALLRPWIESSVRIV